MDPSADRTGTFRSIILFHPRLTGLNEPIRGDDLVYGRVVCNVKKRLYRPRITIRYIFVILLKDFPLRTRCLQTIANKIFLLIAFTS